MIEINRYDEASRSAAVCYSLRKQECSRRSVPADVVMTFCPLQSLRTGSQRRNCKTVRMENSVIKHISQLHTNAFSKLG